MVITDQKQEDIFSEVLSKIRPSAEEFIARRIYHKNFATAIFWLCEQSRMNDYVIAKDLASFLRLSMQRALTYLNEFTEIAGFFKKVYASGGGMAQYYFKLDGNLPVVRNYFDLAIKTLGIKKFKLDIEKENNEIKKRHRKKDDEYF